MIKNILVYVICIAGIVFLYYTAPFTSKKKRENSPLAAKYIGVQYDTAMFQNRTIALGYYRVNGEVVMDGSLLPSGSRFEYEHLVQGDSNLILLKRLVERNTQSETWDILDAVEVKLKPGEEIRSCGYQTKSFNYPALALFSNNSTQGAIKAWCFGTTKHEILEIEPHTLTCIN